MIQKKSRQWNYLMQLLCLETHTPEWQHQRPTVCSSKPPLRTLSQSSPENPIKSNQTRALWDTLWGHCAELAECAKEPVWALCREAPTNCLLCINFWDAGNLCSTGNIHSHLQEQDHTCLFYYKFKKQIEVRVLQRQQSTHLTIRKLTMVSLST